MVEIACNTAKMSHVDWLTARQAGVGGSDVAAILGLSPWKTPYDVWLDKTTPITAEQADQSSEPMYWGTTLEDIVAREYQLRSGRKVVNCNAILQNPAYPHLLANLDRWVKPEDNSVPFVYKNCMVKTKRILECKTSGSYAAHAWKDGVPVYYEAQCQAYLAITGCLICDVAVLIGGNDFRTFVLERDEEKIDGIKTAVSQFWLMVQAGIPPAPVNLEDLAQLYPVSASEKSIVAPELVRESVYALWKIKADIKKLKVQGIVQETVIKELMEENGLLKNDEGKQIASWKTQSKSSFDKKKLFADHPGIDVADYTTKGTSRVFRLSHKLEDIINEY